MRHIFIINPAAGKVDHNGVLRPRIEAAAAEMGANAEIHCTTGFQEAITYVKGCCTREGTEALRFYACGGDGTLNEVTTGVYGCERASVGVIPCGSGNDFIKSLDDRLDFFDIKAQMAGEEKAIDLVQVNDRISVNVANMGFDARIAANVNKFKRLPLVSGATAYNMAIAYVMMGRLSTRLTVEVDGEPQGERAYLLMVAANARYYGGEFKAAPRAELDDGHFDLCTVSNISKGRIMSLIDLYRKGEHITDARFQDIVSYQKCKKLKVTSAQPIPLCVDGEVFYNDVARISILPKALKLIIPKG